MTTRRCGAWLALAVLLTAVAGAWLPACGKRSAKRPNVVFISIDSLRADHLSCYGYGQLTSPRLDRLASQGARFATVVAESSWTLPTHATMLTGLAQIVHGLGTGGRLSDNIVTMPELFQRAGYRTHGIWSGPYLHPYFGLNQGFAEGDYESVMDLKSAPTTAFDVADPGGQHVVGDLHRESYSSRTSAEIVDRALRVVEAASDDPFFLFLHFFDVHYDYDPPEEFWRPFDPRYRGALDAHDWMANPAIFPGMDEIELRHAVALYDGEIRFVDHHIGRLLDALDQRGLAEDTIVVVTADHGDEFFEHGRKGHRNSLFDEVLLVPWIVRWPGVVRPASIVSAQARHVDLMPTLLELAGLDPPYALQGESFASALRGDAVGVATLPAVSRLLLASSDVGVWETLRLDRTKYVRMTSSSNTVEQVYDIVDDPREHRPRTGADVDALKAAARKRLDGLREAELAMQDKLKAKGTTSGALPKEVAAELRQLGYLK